MLNNVGLPGLLLIAVVVLVLFGRGKISSLMGEVGKGITSFKRGVKDGSDEYDRDAAAAAAEAEAQKRAEVTREVPGTAARDVTPSEVTPHTTDRS